MEVGVHDYVIVEHLQIADNQGDAALRMGEASRTLYQIRYFVALGMVPTCLPKARDGHHVLFHSE